jgi:hypothetical protein
MATVGMLMAASAVTANPVVDFNIQVNGGTPTGPYLFSQAGTPTAFPGVFNFNDGGSPLLGPGNEWSIDWDFNADDDPEGTGEATGVMLGANFTIRNNLAEVANPAANHLQFSILITMDVLPAGASFYGVGATNNLLSTGTGPGVVSTTNQFNPGSAMWTYLIDGSSLTTLYNSGHSLSTPTNPGTLAENASSGGPLAGVPSNIGIRLDFDLSPGDEVTFTGTFAYIPAPGALAALALAAIRRSRRRR